MKMQITVDLLRAALIAALRYHPIVEVQVCIPILLKGSKLKSMDTIAGDVFASLYSSVFRFPPDEYELWVKEIFED